MFNSPVIIFSKTYCPHSQAAKNLFLRAYKIVPAPFVVELDDHPHGAELQDLLAKRTGRRTVPVGFTLSLFIFFDALLIVMAVDDRTS